MQSDSLKCSRNNKASAKAKWRWTETCSRIHSHLSLFARCFTNWPTVPNPRFSEIALAEGITMKNDQCQLTNVTEEFFPGSWGSDDRSWKTKIPERVKHWPLRYTGKEQQEQHLTSSSQDALFCQKQVRSLTKTFSFFWCKWCISGNNQPHWPWSKRE